MNITRLGVVGGGQMGAGIGEVAARGGTDVLVMEVNAEFAEQSLARITRSLDKAVDLLHHRSRRFRRPRPRHRGRDRKRVSQARHLPVTRRGDA
jgi:3-hydroxyacyl-CoA dehydrogenase